MVPGGLIKLKTSPARLAQLLQPSLAFCSRTGRYAIIGCKLKNANEGCNSCATVMQVLCFMTCFILLEKLRSLLYVQTFAASQGKHYCTRNTLDCDQTNYSSRIVFSHIPIEFCQTGISAIRSADPENPTVEPNMKWIGRPLAETWLCEIFPNVRSSVVGRSILNIFLHCSHILLFARFRHELYKI